MNKPSSFPPSPTRILSSQCASHAALEIANPLGDHPSAPAPATEPSSRARTGHEKIVPPPLAMRYSHF